VTGTPTPKLTWHWRRCNARGRKCVRVKGATKASYKLRAVDRRRRLRAVATATNSAGVKVFRSKLTGVVR
jgi:hypothetical protein